MEPDQPDRDREVVEAQEALVVADAAEWEVVKLGQALAANACARAAAQLFRISAEFRVVTRPARIAGPE